MKKYAPFLICVLFVMLASTLRHIILPHAKSAAIEYAQALIQTDSHSLYPLEIDI